MSIPIDNITPFTVETIKYNLCNYTYDDYVMGVRGIVKFLKSMILLTNENGEIERNYVCTDASRNTYYRLDEIKKWKVDKGGLFIEKMVDEMILCVLRNILIK